MQPRRSSPSAGYAITSARTLMITELRTIDEDELRMSPS
jgi:hypothetical protein